jgi:hypothetical protein
VCVSLGDGLMPIYRRTGLNRPGRFSFSNNGNYNPSVVNGVFQSQLQVQSAQTMEHTCLNVLYSNASIVLNSSFKCAASELFFCP